MTRVLTVSLVRARVLLSHIHAAAATASSAKPLRRSLSGRRPSGEIVHGWIRVNVVKLDCSAKKSSLKPVFAPTFRMWLEGREDEMAVVQMPQTPTPMYVWLIRVIVRALFGSSNIGGRE